MSMIIERCYSFEVELILLAPCVFVVPKILSQSQSQVKSEG